MLSLEVTKVKEKIAKYILLWYWYSQWRTAGASVDSVLAIEFDTLRSMQKI